MNTYNSVKSGNPLFKALKPLRLNKKGVLILEYVLLLVVCVSMAMVISEVVSIDEEQSDSGWVIKSWMSVLETIAEDM